MTPGPPRFFSSVRRANDDVHKLEEDAPDVTARVGRYRLVFSTAETLGADASWLRCDGRVVPEDRSELARVLGTQFGVGDGEPRTPDLEGDSPPGYREWFPGASAWSTVKAGSWYVYAGPADEPRSAPSAAPPEAPEWTHPADLGLVATGDPYARSLTATPAESYTVVSGDLPDGVELDGRDGLLDGTPASPGEFRFTVRAAAPTGSHADREFSLTVADRPDWVSGAELSATTDPAGDGAVAIAAEHADADGYELVAGVLPPGVEFSRFGVLAGVPRAAGEFRFTARARNDHFEVEREFVLVVEPHDPTWANAVRLLDRNPAIAPSDPSPELVDGAYAFDGSSYLQVAEPDREAATPDPVEGFSISAIASGWDEWTADRVARVFDSPTATVLARKTGSGDLEVELEVRYDGKRARWSVVSAYNPDHADRDSVTLTAGAKWTSTSQFSGCVGVNTYSAAGVVEDRGLRDPETATGDAPTDVRVGEGWSGVVRHVVVYGVLAKYHAADEPDVPLPLVSRSLDPAQFELESDGALRLANADRPTDTPPIAWDWANGFRVRVGAVHSGAGSEGSLFQVRTVGNDAHLQTLVTPEGALASKAAGENPVLFSSSADYAVSEGDEYSFTFTYEPTRRRTHEIAGDPGAFVGSEGVRGYGVASLTETARIFRNWGDGSEYGGRLRAFEYADATVLAASPVVPDGPVAIGAASPAETVAFAAPEIAGATSFEVAGGAVPVGLVFDGATGGFAGTVAEHVPDHVSQPVDREVWLRAHGPPEIPLCYSLCRCAIRLYGALFATFGEARGFRELSAEAPTRVVDDPSVPARTWRMPPDSYWHSELRPELSAVDVGDGVAVSVRARFPQDGGTFDYFLFHSTEVRIRATSTPSGVRIRTVLRFGGQHQAEELDIAGVPAGLAGVSLVAAHDGSGWKSRVSVADLADGSAIASSDGPAIAGVSDTTLDASSPSLMSALWDTRYATNQTEVGDEPGTASFDVTKVELHRPFAAAWRADGTAYGSGIAHRYRADEASGRFAYAAPGRGATLVGGGAVVLDDVPILRTTGFTMKIAFGHPGPVSHARVLEKTPASDVGVSFVTDGDGTQRIAFRYGEGQDAIEVALPQPYPEKGDWVQAEMVYPAGTATEGAVGMTVTTDAGSSSGTNAVETHPIPDETASFLVGNSDAQDSPYEGTVREISVTAHA